MRLIKGNVERVSENERMIARLKSEGFREMNAPAATVSGEESDPSKMNTAQLKELAKSKGISGYASLTKAELLEVLKDVV